MNRHDRRKQQSLRGTPTSNDIAAAFARGVERHRAGDLRGAEEIYRQVVEWSPSSPEPWNYLGAIALGVGDMPRAEARYAKALALRADWPEVLHAHASALHALGRFDEARVELERATELDPKLHQAWNGLGITLQRGGDVAGAQRCFERASELAPAAHAYVFNLGTNLKLQRRFAEARAVLQRALQLHERHPEALAQLAACWKAEGNDDEAARCYREYLEVAPEDAAGAKLFLAARSGNRELPAPAPAYVRELFDEYAQAFDEHLVGRLDYRVPELLEERLARKLGTQRGKRAVLDLGCGTGLAGARFAAHAARLVGVDLSAGMLQHARQRGVYHELVQAEALEFLRRGRESFDLVLAADVFNYVGELRLLLEALAKRVAADGWLAFSVEAGAAGVQLSMSLRFTHGEEYLRAELARAGFEIDSLEREKLRVQDGQPVEGFLVLASRRGA